MKDRSIWLIPSSPLDPATLNTLQELASDGPGVQHLVAPDLEHHLFLSQYIQAFPQAKVYVPKRVKDNWTKSSDQHLKNAAERIHFVFGLGQPDPFEATTGGEIKSVDFAASHVNEVSGSWTELNRAAVISFRPDTIAHAVSVPACPQDIAFLHVPTRTLIQADLMFNLPPTEQVRCGRYYEHTKQALTRSALALVREQRNSTRRVTNGPPCPF